MRTYIKALSKCRYPVSISNAWLRPWVWLHKNGMDDLAATYGNWWASAHNWHDEQKKDMKSHARIFIGYDGALECAGRDTDEFLQTVTRGMDESIMYWAGIVAPRVQMEISFDDPERFPYHYVKWTTLLNMYKFKTHLLKHEPWIWASVALLATNILILI